MLENTKAKWISLSLRIVAKHKQVLCQCVHQGQQVPVDLSTLELLPIIGHTSQKNGVNRKQHGGQQLVMVLSARISVRLSHDALPVLPARFQRFKRICPRKFKQISPQSPHGFVCTTGGIGGPVGKSSHHFRATKERNPKSSTSLSDYQCFLE